MLDWLTLLWWLGPWCDQSRVPKEIQCQDHEVPFRFRVYRPRQYSKAVMVLPGLHPDGLDDARLDRFCRVLASAGVMVGISELPTMMRSMMAPELLDETITAAEYFHALCIQEGYPTFGIFCISASSIAGLHLATHPTFENRISKVHLFGGFADWKESLRFAMTGNIPIDPPEQIVVDPLSLPVVYMNLLSCFPSFVTDALELPALLRDPLMDSLFEYVSLSWEKPDVIHPQDTQQIADRIVRDLQQGCPQQVDKECLTQRFLEGCALRSGGQARVHRFLDGVAQEHHASVSWLDPKPLLHTLQVPLDVSHGRDDFVVPYPQADMLATLAPPSLVHTYVTGLYHHTGTVSFRRMLSMLIGLPKELWISIQMVWALSKLGK